MESPIRHPAVVQAAALPHLCRDERMRHGLLQQAGIPEIVISLDLAARQRFFIEFDRVIPIRVQRHNN